MFKVQVSIDAEPFIQAVDEMTEAVLLLEEKLHQLETANITVNIMGRQSDIDVDCIIDCIIDRIIDRINRECKSCSNGDD